MPDPSKDGRMPSFIEGTRLMCEKYKIICAALVTGPFTVACELGGAENVASSMITNPEYVRALMEYTTNVSKVYIRALADAGVDMILLGDPTAGMMSRKHFWEFLGEKMKDLIVSSPIPVLLHICGDTDHLIELMVRLKPVGLSLDKVDLAAAVPRIPKDVVIIGNIDPIQVLEQGSPDEVKREVEELFGRMEGIPAFICAPGCDVSPQTPIENLAAMAAAIREQG
jgi:uroporphyrinogen decarboxylase